VGFSPHIAERRFGYGMSPHVAPPASVTAMLDALRGPDQMADRFPIPGFRAIQDAQIIKRRFDVFARKDTTPAAEAVAARQKSRDIVRKFIKQRLRSFGQMQLRRIQGGDNFRERLVAFWADHFTAQGKMAMLKLAVPAYVEEAVRPNVSGRFADLLIACVTHPVMLEYLDQSRSIGPSSKRGTRKGSPRGLNENLARELLELHTLGVSGPYTQNDVRQMAELLTGMSRTRDYSFVFRKGWAEPGTETVLGKTYGARNSMEPIHAALEDLALHPVTARHLASKLATHFVSDTPPPALVADLTAAYLDSKGDLMALYDALLLHPLSWQMPATNIRPPLEYVSTALRALAVPENTFAGLRPKDTSTLFLRPLSVMGQVWLEPSGPDGWPEADGAWVTPQGIAARLEWAMNVPSRLLDDLPEPAAFLAMAVGPDAPEALKFATSAAENRAVAVGLVLASPAMQRR
jgi:uncharacterized protein (DUF1800 family)